MKSKALEIAGKGDRVKCCVQTDRIRDLIPALFFIEPNGTEEEIKLGILHNVNGYWVSNEGTKQKPNYHVWIPSLTHSVCDSAYAEIDIAVCRCNYLAKNRIEANTSHLHTTP